MSNRLHMDYHADKNLKSWASYLLPDSLMLMHWSMSNYMVKFTPKPIVSCLHKGVILPRQILYDLCHMICLHNCTEVKISHGCGALSTRYTWEHLGSLLRVVKHYEIGT